MKRLYITYKSSAFYRDPEHQFTDLVAGDIEFRNGEAGVEVVFASGGHRYAVPSKDVVRIEMKDE